MELVNNFTGGYLRLYHQKLSILVYLTWTKAKCLTNSTGYRTIGTGRTINNHNNNKQYQSLVHTESKQRRKNSPHENREVHRTGMVLRRSVKQDNFGCLRRKHT